MSHPHPTRQDLSPQERGRLSAQDGRAAAEFTRAYDRLLEAAQRCGAPLTDLRAGPGTLHARLLGHALRATATRVERRLPGGTWATLHPDDWGALHLTPPAPDPLQGLPVPARVRARLHRVTLLARADAAAPAFQLRLFGCAALSCGGLMVSGAAPAELGFPASPDVTAAFEVAEQVFLILVVLTGVLAGLVLALPHVHGAQVRRLTQELKGLRLLPRADQAAP